MMSADTTAIAPANLSPYVVFYDIMTALQPKAGANLVFLGDSITWSYENGAGAPIWSAYLAGAGAAGYGVIGQTTQSLLYQLSLGLLREGNPSVIVLTIGTNNLIENDSPQATAAGILADVNAIHQYQPKAQVLVLGVPPGHADPNDPFRLAGDQTNALVSQQLAGDPRATYFDIASAFEDSNGVISNLMMFDYIHPTPLGYTELTIKLVPAIFQAYLASHSQSSTG